MALYFILKAMEFPPGSEIIVPALTFWVVPEIARVAGLTPVFADIDPATFTLVPGGGRARDHAEHARRAADAPLRHVLRHGADPRAGAAPQPEGRSRTARIRSAPPTRAGWSGRSGDASFFSFQAFKPLNTYGGGLAWMRDAELARRVGEFADGEQWPTEKRVESILWAGKWQHTFIRPRVFTYSLFPIWYAASWVNAKPEERLWEGVRRLDPLPEHTAAGSRTCRRRSGSPGSSACPNSSSGPGGTRGCWTVCSATCPASRSRRSRRTARTCTTSTAPTCPTATRSSSAASAAAWTWRRCTSTSARDGVVRLEGPAAPGAEKAATAVQVPVYESLSDQEIERVGRAGREQVERLPRTRERLVATKLTAR